jgi:carboxyl-terminal processing protease
MKKIIPIIAFVLALGASFFIGRYTVEVGYTGATDIDDAVFLEVMQELMDNHYSQPDYDLLMEGAIEGMIGALDDPHTSYFDYEEYQQFQNNFDETYIGIGVSVLFTDGLIVVEEVKDGGPADEAGVRPNDIIAFIDGLDVTEMEYYEAISNVLGDEGTDVSIGIIRSGVEDVINLTMTRAVIDNSSITYRMITSGTSKIGYIEVTTFGDETATKFADAITALEEDHMDSLIVDLRNNGGGHLGTVYAMMSELLINNNKPMFSTEYYSNGEYIIQDYYSSNYVQKDYNIVTLVNEFSASASEVFASGMQEQGGYTLVGTKTYGKGTMQTDAVLRATINDRLHISIGKWVTSDGNWVHFSGGTDGITPDLLIEQNAYETAYKLFFLEDETFVYDTVDDRIANMQLILSIMGYDVREDGYFDLATKNAIEDIQSNNGLTVDGIVTEDVLAILNTALDAYQDNPDNDTQLAAAVQYLVDNPTLD